MWSGLLKDGPENPVSKLNNPPEKQFLLCLEESCCFSSEACNEQLSATKSFQGAGSYLKREQIRQCGLKRWERILFIPYTSLFLLKLSPTHRGQGKMEERSTGVQTGGWQS